MNRRARLPAIGSLLLAVSCGSEGPAAPTFDALVIATVSLPSGFMNMTYRETLAALGGDGSHSWSLAVGTPPTGLSLDSSTGSISGTPSVGGTHNFTVEVTSGDGQTAQQALSIQIGFTVNTTDDLDDGTCNVTHCSLREALTGANGDPGTDVIHFDIPGAGPHTIQPESALPTIADPMVLDGYTQPGASPNSNGPGTGSNAVLNIELDGTNAGASHGLSITAGSSTVRGLVINRFHGGGIAIPSGSGNVIEGNLIGIDATGTLALGNAYGVSVGPVSGGLNRIGGTVPEARNVVSGNGSFGIVISGGAGNLVQGNFVGTDVTGTARLGNTSVGVGVSVSNTTVGGETAGARNVVSANGAAGVQLSGVGQGVTSNIVQGNFIGTDVTGTIRLGNVAGITVFDNANTVIGGATAGAGNVVSGNGSTGVYLGGARETVIQGNFIGTDATGIIEIGNGGPGIAIGEYTAGSNVYHATDNSIGGNATGARNIISGNAGSGVSVTGSGQSGNSILSNAIFSNGYLGIDLGPFGVTANDSGDGDLGPNNAQNFPVLALAATGGDSLAIAGDLNSSAGTPFLLEFFASSACDPSGNGEGERFLGSGTATTDGNGDAAFTFTLAAVVGVDQFVTATATDPNDNTSEFSQCMAVS